MSIVRIVLRLCRNRLLLRDPDLGHRPRPLELAIFALNLFPLYNLLCWMWIKACVLWEPRFPVLGRVSRYLVGHGFLYGALRHLSPEDKNAFSAGILQRGTNAGPSRRTASVPTGLATHGYARLGRVVNSAGVDSVVGYFRAKGGYLAQTPLQSDGILRPFDPGLFPWHPGSQYFCFPLSTSLACPEIATLLRHPVVNDVATAYLGRRPQLYSVNTFATIKGAGEHYVMRLHRDYDDFSAVAFFVYWTDVRADDGATLYIPGSHVSSRADREARDFLVGDAGSLFVLDAFGLHAGNRSVESVRLVTWIRFGTVPNLATIQDGGLIPFA